MSIIKKKHFYVVLVFILGFLFMYFSSYCFLLPVLEKIGANKIAYIIYEPVEFVRFRSQAMWNITERGYAFFGGRCEDLKRAYFSTPRKHVEFWNGNNNKIHSVFYGINGRWHGPHYDYYENGQLWSKGYYKHGLLDGESILFYPDGSLSSRSYHRNGFSDGERILYDENGNITRIDSYKKGKAHERFVRYFSETKYVSDVNNYVDGFLEGRQARYYPCGQIKSEIAYKNGLPDGRGATYYKNGSLCRDGEFRCGVLCGGHLVVNWDFGIIAEGVYRDGKKWSGTFLNKNQDSIGRYYMGRMISSKDCGWAINTIRYYFYYNDCIKNEFSFEDVFQKIEVDFPDE